MNSQAHSHPARRTKIITTLGPATESDEVLKGLVEKIDIARLNFTHAQHGWASEAVKRIRHFAAAAGRPVAVMMDTQGPSIRTGSLEKPLELKPGGTLVFTVHGEKEQEFPSVDVNYDFVNDVRVGDTVLVDNGVIRMEVLEKHPRKIRCRVLTEGVLGSHRHINLPGVHVNLPSITSKDLEDIEWAIQNDLEWIALSFVREARDIAEVRKFLKEHGSDIRIIAKIEDQEAVANFDELMEAADALMIARGDLGIECHLEELPIIQRRIVKRCLYTGTTVIVATHILESMIEKPIPTRAEVTDAANAVYEQADAVMLSGETSIGKYPLQAVDVLDRIARRIERSGGANYAEKAAVANPREKLAHSAVIMANDLRARALIVFTRYGQMPKLVSWLRPRYSAIFAFCDNPKVVRQMQLLWGVHPFELQFQDDPEKTVAEAIKVLKKNAMIQKDEWVVSISHILSKGLPIDSVQMRVVE